jgi:phage shock protein C
MTNYRYRRYAERARATVNGNGKIGLYKIPEDGILLGVCAGIADHFGVFAWVVRVIAFVLLVMLPFPMLVAYGLLGLLLPARPLRFDGDGSHEREFWSRQDDSDGVAL